MHLKINSRSIIVQKYAFNSCYRQKEVEIHAEASLNIEQDAFRHCIQLKLSKVKLPKIMKCIVEGNFDMKKYL